ncbi:uncharacterized protein AAG666_008223 isoform 2-T2 [Megaptera novaeangliae]
MVTCSGGADLRGRPGRGAAPVVQGRPRLGARRALAQRGVECEPGPEPPRVGKGGEEPGSAPAAAGGGSGRSRGARARRRGRDRAAIGRAQGGRCEGGASVDRGAAVRILSRPFSPPQARAPSGGGGAGEAGGGGCARAWWSGATRKVEELLMAMEKVKQELESMKAKLSCTQQSLAEKETHLTNLRAERRKHLEEVLEMKNNFQYSY